MSTSADSIASAVKRFILDSFLPGEDASSLADDTPLMTSGILDSLATLDLVAFLEQQYSIELGARDVDASRLGTIADITRLVQSKLSATA